MRKTLLQSFLLSVLMLLAPPVWAQEIEDQVSFYFEDEVNPFIDDSRITSAIEYDETLGSNVLGWTCANNAYNGYSFSHFDFSGDLVNNTEEVEITFDYYNEKGSRSILSIGDAGVRGNTGGSSKQTYNSSGAFFRIGSDKNNAFICGTNYSQNDICDKWVHVNVIVNLVDKNIFWDVYVWDEETKTFSFHEAFNGDYYSEDGAVCSQIDVFGCMNNSHCCMIDNLEIKSKTGNYEHASYTIRYVDYEDNELKPSRVAEGYVDHPVELLPSDTENFYSNDGTKKYIFDSIDAPDVASDGSTVVTVFFREAETYYAKLNCMSNDSYELLAQVTGSFFEGDNLTLYPSRGYGKDGKFYMTGATNWNGVTYTFPAALSPSVIDGKTTYTGILLYNEDASVAYYSDFERLALPIEDAGEGIGLGQLVGSVNNWWSFTNGYFSRFSGARGIRLDAGSYVWTEPIAEDGTYMVRIYGRNDNSANCEQPYALGYRDAEGNVTLFDVPVPDWASATTGESVVGAAAVEADEEHDAVKAAGIGLKAGWSLVVKNTGNGSMISLDDVTLTKVADYAPDEVSALIPDGTYYVMSANTGTLINAEGALDEKGTPITFNFDNVKKTYAIEGVDFFNGKEWTIADAVENITGYYTISTEVDGVQQFLSVSAENTVEQITDGSSDDAVWILLKKAYWEDIVWSTYIVAGTKNLTGTANDWDVVDANRMALNDKTGLYEKKFKRITIDSENQPEFKVVKTDIKGESHWYPNENWVITTSYVGGEGLYDITITFDPSDLKEIGVTAEERIVFPDNATIFDFEAAADAGENPDNLNGDAANGQAFYGWEKEDKTDGYRQDYKGYVWKEGSVLPEVCQVWRRSDRINGNLKNGGLYCPNDREMAIDGLTPNSKVTIVYDATNAAEGNKEMIWAIGVPKEGPRATATIDGIEAVSGETTIPSGAEIVVYNVTPAENGTGYIVFKVKKGMIIKQIAIVPDEVSGEEAPELVAPKGWTSGITNGNLAGDDVSSFVMKEYPSVDIVPAAIVAGAGTDGGRGILVKAGDDTENKAAADWDSQFWIVLDDELPSGTKLHVEFDYKASQAAKAITMTHGNPGAYHHWAAIGDVNFTTEWQHFTTDIEVNDAMAKGDNGNGSGTGLKSICFCLQIEKSATDYCFDNFGVWYQKPVVIDDWTDIIVNGDMEGENNECFYVTEQGIGGPFLAQFTEGIGKDGSRAVKVESYDDPAQDWDTQFFIRLPYQLLPEGKFRISFDYKADKAGDFDTQSHTEPGGYITWACVGSGSFTTDWKHYEAEGTITADMSKEGQLFQTICFNLAKNKVRTNFIFDNVKFEIPTDYLATLTKNPAVDPKPYTKPVYNSMAIVGDFLGLEGDANWEPTNGWEMAQDAENPAVWTLTKGFVAEAKTYEYQAAANGKLDYVLPKDGKAGFNFDDPNLGAAAYDLTFTVDTRLHSLDLDVQKTVLTTYTATFTTDAAWTDVYAYAWSGEEPHVTKFLGDWPGTKLEAVDGVYTVSIVSKDAPEKIIFNNGSSGEGNQTADLDFVNGSAYEFKAASGVEAPELVAPEGWKNAITNGNLAGDDVSSFVMKEYPSVDIVPAAIVAGAGTNGSRGILVKAGDDTENKAAADWDSQFWIVLDDELPSGTKLHVEFDYKASQAAKAITMANGNPGIYHHYAAIGDVNFTTEWQHFTTDIEVNDAMAKGDNGNGSGTGLKSIGFCLQIEKSATDYRFDNFGVWYQKPDEEIDDGTVKLPKGLEIVTYQMTYKDYDGKVNYAPVNVAVDGNDVYFQGMSEYYPEAWVKGTKDGNIILFPAMQFMGENELIGPSYYFYNGDAAFTYDAGTDTYSSEGEIYGILNESYYDGHIFNPVIKRVVDMAAMPANPEITNMMDTGYYGWRFDFNVPLEDVNGNPLVTSKLVYKIYSDTKGVIKALTFTPATHVKLTEDMTEIPYGFTDSWDFYSTQLYLNGLYSDEWDKIGIQSIYYGGGEVNATEIQWYDLRLVRAPEDLATQTYGFSGYDTYYSRDVTGEVQVGFYGEDEVYIQGLSKYLPEAWVKGKLVDGTLTIPQTYLGVYTDDDEWTDDSDVFFTGTTFFYNEEAGTFYSDGGYVTYESPEAEYYMDEFKYVLLTKLLDVAAIPANPEIINFNYLDTDYPILQFEIPTVDINGNSLIKSKLAYQIYYFKNNEVTTLVLTKDLYPELDADMTEIPYGFKAGDIYPTLIYLNQIDQEIDSWQMIGIQSIYYGGYDRNISDIVWFTNDNADGIRSVDNAKMDNVPVYNLSGQRIDNSQFTIHNSQLKRGIYIVNGKKITVK